MAGPARLLKKEGLLKKESPKGPQKDELTQVWKAPAGASVQVKVVCLRLALRLLAVGCMMMQVSDVFESRITIAHNNSRRKLKVLKANCHPNIMKYHQTSI